MNLYHYFIIDREMKLYCLHDWLVHLVCFLQPPMIPGSSSELNIFILVREGHAVNQRRDHLVWFKVMFPALTSLV
jgi:hypothetical protein